jgi:hypothetical protein
MGCRIKEDRHGHGCMGLMYCNYREWQMSHKYLSTNDDKCQERKMQAWAAGVAQ